jgi:hypothetical protein
MESPNNKCAIVARKFSTKQEGNMSWNMKEFSLYAVRNFKTDIATAMEKLNSNFKSQNTILAKDIPSRMISEFASKFQTKAQVI